MVNRKEKTNRRWLILFCTLSVFLAGCLLMIKIRPWTAIVGHGTSVTDNQESKQPEENDIVSQYGPLSDIHIDLQFGKMVEMLTLHTIADWVTVQQEDGSFSYTVDEAAVKRYAKALADRYSNYESTVSFKAADGRERQLPNMSTGWIFDEAYAAEQLTQFIRDNHSVKLVLTDQSDESNRWWVRVASDYEAAQKQGSCYAEVSISQQRMWLHQNGKIILQSPVVTGNPSEKNDTPTGAFVVQNKEQNALLYGADYMTTVKYWIGFAYGIGFHDADWQEKFGGTVYLENGSHGCVNMPDDAVEKLYQLAYVNMPVYVYA